MVYYVRFKFPVDPDFLDSGNVNNRSSPFVVQLNNKLNNKITVKICHWLEMKFQNHENLDLAISKAVGISNFGIYQN